MKFVWPVEGMMRAEGGKRSFCEVGFEGQWGYDLFAEDGGKVFAAFDGTVHTFTDPQYGCVIELVSTDGEYFAYYSYLQRDGMAIDGEKVAAGDLIAKAGGGQEDAVCRGASPGPRLNFGVLDSVLGWSVDPFTCVTNTCKFYYTDSTGSQCYPDLFNTDDCLATPDADGRYDLPSYACVNADGKADDRFYSHVSIDKYGNLDTGSYTVDGVKVCKSEVYDQDLKPMIAEGTRDFDSLNCFLRFLRIRQDGSVECGHLAGATMVWGGAMPAGGLPTGDCKQVVSLGISEQTRARNSGYTMLQIIPNPKNASLLYNWVIVSGEYQIIGVNDGDYVDKMSKNRRYLNITDPGSYNAMKGDEGFNPSRDAYSIDYVLARGCDLQATTVSTAYCKSQTIALPEGKYDLAGKVYADRIRDGSYQDCRYDLIDGGKFWDWPGDYISKFWMGRFAANRGLRYYE